MNAFVLKTKENKIHVIVPFSKVKAICNYPDSSEPDFHIHVGNRANPIVFKDLTQLDNYYRWLELNS